MPSDMNQNKSDEEFLGEVRPKLEILEDIRRDKFKIFSLRKKMAMPIGAVMTPVLGFIDYWLVLLQRGNEDMLAGVTAVGLAGLWGWVTKPKRDYAKEYKTKLLPDIASIFGQFTYDVKGKLPMKAMKPSKIIPNHSSYRSEDLFEGEYRGVGISFSEIHLSKRRKKSTVTVFKGLGVLLTHGTRKFHGHTILTKDQGKLGAWFQKQTNGLKRANMVDLEFERLFDVYTNDQTEARYLIDPIIIESLKDLYEEYSGNQMMAAFYEGHVLILIGSKVNHFEPAAIEVPATSEKELLSMKHEIGQILSIVDRLSLYDPRKRREAQRQAETTETPQGAAAAQSDPIRWTPDSAS